MMTQICFVMIVMFCAFLFYMKCNYEICQVLGSRTSNRAGSTLAEHTNEESKSSGQGPLRM